MTHRSISAFETFRRDERGSLTIEFCLWVPVLIFWLVLSITVYDTYRSRMQASNVAFIISDIVSRLTEFTTQNLTDIEALQTELLIGVPGQAELRITSVTCIKAAPDLPCTYTVNWSVRSSSSSSLAIITNPNELPVLLFPTMQDREEILLVDQTVPHTPISASVGLAPRSWDTRLVTRSRNSRGLAATPDLIAAQVVG